MTKATKWSLKLEQEYILNWTHPPSNHTSNPSHTEIQRISIKTHDAASIIIINSIYL